MWSDRTEVGGERDILLAPCRIVRARPAVGGTPVENPAWLWSTTTAARDRPDPWVVAVISAVPLRATHGLADGALVAVEPRDAFEAVPSPAVPWFI